MRPESGTREESPILSKVKGCQRKIERDRSFHLRSLRPTSSPRRLSKHKEERFDFLKELGVSLVSSLECKVFGGLKFKRSLCNGSHSLDWRFSFITVYYLLK